MPYVTNGDERNRRWIAVLAIVALALFGPVMAADDEKVDDLEERIEKLEVKAARDRIQFTGDLRVTVDSIGATQAEHFDGLALQKGNLDTFFYLNQTGTIPGSYQEVADEIAANYGDYLYFQNNLSFDQVKEIFAGLPQYIGSLPPADQMAFMQYLGALQQSTYVPEQDYNNDILYTTRLRLGMRADVMDNVTFDGRLSMYKTWGDSTGVQVFNGIHNSFNVDGTTTSVPNSDILRVDRAYFNWKQLGGSNVYLSIGRRPSTFGPPLHVAENELRQGTPNGHVVDFQFDGITIGIGLDRWLPGNTFRFCYGLGFESGFGSADQLKAPADRLGDTNLGGINWDLYNTDRMHIQTTILGAWGVADGFNGLLVLPTDPVSGNPVPAPAVLRFTPSDELGDIYLADVLLERNDGRFNWFASLAYSETDPTGATSPFGGLLSDPFEVPEKQDGYSVFIGARFDIGAKDSLGLEYNYGSQYWFNFTQAADDLVASKLATRGSAYEVYWLHQFKQGLGRARARLQLGATFYDYEYSGSGFQTGAPKELGGSDVPVLGFPTYQDALDLRAALTVKF